MPGWIKALIGTVACVMAANAVLLWQALYVRRDLVRKDYYEAGLNQNVRMARRALADSLGLRVTFGRDSGGFRVEAVGSGAVAGGDPLSLPLCRAEFYRPDDGREDHAVDLARENGGAAWSGPAPSLRHGHWRVTLLWMDGSKAVMEKYI
jgi:nitrogen fixation protein FixH